MFFPFVVGVNIPKTKGSIKRLVTFDEMPRLSWTKKDWNKYNKFVLENDCVIFKLSSEFDFFYGNEYLKNREYYFLKGFIENFWNDRILIESINYMNCSLEMFDGNILNNFPLYEFRDKPFRLSEEVLEKSYLEFRTKFEISFLSAYKGIERLFCVNQIIKKDIKNHLINLGIDPESKYNCMYLKLNNAYKIENYFECINLFRDVRSTVAAHSNKNPPYEKQINLYLIYEIQKFLNELIQSYIEKMLKR
jgi:hypothetical protein